MNGGADAPGKHKGPPPLSPAPRADPLRPGGIRGDDDQDESYCAEVARRLDRALTRTEVLLARQMRRQGKSAAECAAILRGL